MAIITIHINTDIEQDVQAIRDIAETAAWLLDKSAEVEYSMDTEPGVSIFNEPNVIVDLHRELPEEDRYVQVWAPTEWYFKHYQG